MDSVLLASDMAGIAGQVLLATSALVLGFIALWRLV